jgi:O-antigen biosynthesis protein
MPFNLSDYLEATAAPHWLTANSAWIYHIPMAPILIKLLRPRSLVELGTFAGDSYMSFCQAVGALGTDTRCLAVDTWQGDAHSSTYGPEVLAALRAAHDPLYSSFSALIPATFDQARTRFADASIDLLHIDGYHTYDAVHHDFTTWQPKLTDRGVVLFHDTAIREGDFGVFRLWEELSADYPAFEVPYGCGLGILAAGQNVPPAFLDFLSELRQGGPNGPILAQLKALGERIEYQRRNMTLSHHLHTTQTRINQFRTLTGQPIENPTSTPEAIMQDPTKYSTEVARQSGLIFAQSLQLLQEVTTLRQRVAALPLPLPQS